MNRRDLLKLGAAATVGSVTLSFLGPVAVAQGRAQLTAAQRFKIGDITVTTVSDGYIELKPELFSGVTEEDFQKRLKDAFLKPGAYRGAVNAFVVDTGSQVYIIDSGTGSALGPTLGNVAANLTAAGYDPSAVATLIVTHLHPDHIGGSFKDGKPVFEAAEFIVSETDRDFWASAENREKAPEQAKAFFDLATGSLKAYGDRVRTIDGETEVAPGITSVPLPGHTPGHTGYRITSGDDSLLVWADIVHAAPVQLPNPDVTIGFDIDPALAAKTRKALLVQVVPERTMIAGAHLPFPGVGYIEKAGEGYRFVPAGWEYL